MFNIGNAVVVKSTKTTNYMRLAGLRGIVVDIDPSRINSVYVEIPTLHSVEHCFYSNPVAFNPEEIELDSVVTHPGIPEKTQEGMLPECVLVVRLKQATKISKRR